MENWKFAISSILGHKLRAFLTMLGIIIGVASVVVIMALGNGLRDSVSKSLTKDQQNVTLYFEETPSETEDPFAAMYASGGQAPDLNENWMKELVASVDGVDNYYLTNQTSATVESKHKVVENVNITGINATYFEVKQYKILAGRSFNQSDYRSFGRVIMLDTQLAVKLFGANQKALNQIVTLGEKSYLVVGIYEDPDAGTAFYGARSNGNAVMANTQLAAEYGMQEAANIFVHVTDPLRAMEIGQAAADKLTQIAGLQQGRYAIFDLRQALSQANQEIGMVTGIIGTIASISLLVGGIGVMNIMLVSVTERTREIGLRKALGATRRNILTQFLIEAMVLTMMGGVIGLVLAYGVVAIINSFGGIFGGSKLIVSISTVIGSVIFSGLIGSLFGILPANKASKLNPIEALRYE